MKSRTLLFGLICLLLLSTPLASKAAVPSLLGSILLQIEANGEAWYVSPVTAERYYLGRPDDAFAIMRNHGLGISNKDFAAFEYDFGLRERLKGRILLEVEKHGEAWYVNPQDLRRYYLGRPADAFRIMSKQGLGISNRDLSTIREGSVDHTPIGASRASNDITNSVPFFTQAPLGEWSDPRQADGCEEAVSLMAITWARGETLSSTEARDKIISVSDWEENQFGYYRDTSIQDTEDRILNEYFDYSNTEVQEDITSSDVLRELENGHIVIVPINGRIVNHPYYTPPGPERHVIVVHGYERATNTFITHDPGTRHGANHRIPYNTLNQMMRDYTSGDHAPIGEGGRSMIVIRKQ